jgi:hypothetical protein
MSIETLITKQNTDGGWPYIRGASSTEPTVYAVMALLAAGERDRAGLGLRWLRGTQRRDGGWAPQAGVDQSNWTTALVALLPPEVVGVRFHASAIEWLMGTIGHESSFEYRLREWLLGNNSIGERDSEGWPWIPGAAAWVGPTAVSVLALEKENRRRPLRGIRERIEAGRKFLLERTCRDGGWNHGAIRVLGYDSNAYPETTGMALAALRGVNSPDLLRSLPVARRFLAECRSADAQNWLRLGLAAHGELPPGYCRPRDISYRTISETSLDLLLSDMTASHGFFWS